MIPAFNDNGYLPPGIHPAALEEIAERFGSGSEIRRVQMESIRWLVEIAARAGVTKIVLNGSFTTDQEEPNDVDCVLLVAPDSLLDEVALLELHGGVPFLELQIVEETEFPTVTQYFGTDRDRVAKGMLEIKR